jgi:hypothetical protein
VREMGEAVGEIVALGARRRALLVMAMKKAYQRHGAHGLPAEFVSSQGGSG